MTCKHPQPGLCNVLGVHVLGGLWNLWIAPTKTGEKYRRHWCGNAGVDLEETRKKYKGGSVGGPAYTTNCTHRGTDHRLQKCPSCKGSVNAKVHPCTVHGECTLFSKPIEGVMRCPCPDQEVPKENDR